MSERKQSRRGRKLMSGGEYKEDQCWGNSKGLREEGKSCSCSVIGCAPGQPPHHHVLQELHEIQMSLTNPTRFGKGKKNAQKGHAEFCQEMDLKPGELRAWRPKRNEQE